MQPPNLQNGMLEKLEFVLKSITGGDPESDQPQESELANLLKVVMMPEGNSAPRSSVAHQPGASAAFPNPIAPTAAQSQSPTPDSTPTPSTRSVGAAVPASTGPVRAQSSAGMGGI
jgi:hypothetical protein